MKKIFGLLSAGFLFVGCAEQTDMDMGGPAEVETDRANSGWVQTPEEGQPTANTNITDEGNARAPGAGSAVGGDVSGSGTAPLREEQEITPPPVDDGV